MIKAITAKAIYIHICCLLSFDTTTTCGSSLSVVTSVNTGIGTICGRGRLQCDGYTGDGAGGYIGAGNGYTGDGDGGYIGAGAGGTGTGAGGTGTGAGGIGIGIGMMGTGITGVGILGMTGGVNFSPRK